MLVGRDRERAQLEEALVSARQGRGGTCLIRGESGIGKTRLVEEVAREVTGLRVLWGRCWEAGGAPAYWPWVQALRELVSSEAGDLGTVLQAAGTPFGTLDAVRRLLERHAAETPLLVVLEDLHAADLASVQLLDLMTPTLRAAPVLVVVTARASCEDPAVGDAIEALRRGVTDLALQRLTGAEVAAVVRQELDEPALVEAVVEAAEGHPLFAVELARQVRFGGGVDPAHLPRTVQSVLEGRLAALDAVTRSTLARGAVEGRSFSAASVAGDAGVLQRACEAQLIAPMGSGSFRFTHGLVREVLYRSLAPHARRAVHGVLAASLAEQAARGGAPWSEVAHHALTAGSSHAELAAEAGVRARMDEGRAHLAAGDEQAACRSWDRAVADARDTRDGALFTEAALARGERYTFARVDRALVAVLEEAREVVPEGRTSLRARLLARLAAAYQPAEDAAHPIALAREAAAVVAGLSAPRVRLQVLRAAGSALVDLADPEERLPMDRAYLEVAQQQDAAADIQRAWLRLTIDAFEVGDVKGATDALSGVVRVAERHAGAGLRWRACAARVTTALWRADFGEAAAQLTSLREAGLASGDTNHHITWLVQSAQLARFRGDLDALAALHPQLSRIYTGSPVGDALSVIWAAATSVHLGRLDEADAWMVEGAAESALGFGDRSMLAPVAEVAAALGHTDLARQLLPVWEREAGRFVASGVTGLTWWAPVSRYVGLCRGVLGEWDAAVEAFVQAGAQVRVHGGRAWQAWIGADEVEALRAVGNVEEARARAAEVKALATSLGMASVVDRLTLGGTGLTVDTTSRPPALVREGDGWAFVRGSRRSHLADIRGVQMLAMLMTRPGQEMHVLDLSGAGVVDGGDAGPVIDDQARAAYKARLLQVQAELEQAEDWGDLGRQEQLQAEYDALVQQLSAAFGLGQRARRTSSAAERARVNVRKRLKDALKRIAAHDPDGAAEVERGLSTGMYCSWAPT